MKQSVFHIADGCKLILASSSPRRRQLLASLGIPFSICEPGENEPAPEEYSDPGDFSLLCARIKNSACQQAFNNTAIILSADTVVTIDNEILGKPDSHDTAFKMLTRLNGREHTVFTSFCLHLPNGQEIEEKCSAKVKFHKWPESVIAAYAADQEPMDKAGAYAIQGMGTFLVDTITGSWTTVAGLPMAELVHALLKNNLIMPAICK